VLNGVNIIYRNMGIRKDKIITTKVKVLTGCRKSFLCCHSERSEESDTRCHPERSEGSHEFLPFTQDRLREKRGRCLIVDKHINFF
jgi:hypothetical protein